MSQIKRVPIEKVDPNPYRIMGKYPFCRRKVEALKLSMKTLGLWESVLARETPDGRYQIAFGHHRLQAAKEIGLVSVSLIIRELTNKEMIQFMGRENMEDYNSDFLIMLSTWESGVKYVEESIRDVQEVKSESRMKSTDFKSHEDLKIKVKLIDIADILGWVIKVPDREKPILSPAAYACGSAYNLIKNGYMTKDEFVDIPVRVAREIAGRATKRIKFIEQKEKAGEITSKEAREAKIQVATGASHVIDRVKTRKKSKSGREDLGAQVDIATHRYAKTLKKKQPIFRAFADKLASSIEKMLVSDAAARNLNEVAKSIKLIELEEDRRTVRRLNHVLTQHIKDTEKWAKKMVLSGGEPEEDNIVSFTPKLIEDKR